MKTLLLGDLSPTPVSAPLFKAKKLSVLFGDAVALFENKDFVLVNLECALTEHDTPIKKFGPPLKAPSETAEILKSFGVTCCGLSNNHIFDYGIKGAADTLDVLNKNGIDYTGFGDNYEDSRKNYTFEKNGEKICVVAVCEHEYSYALDDRMGSRPFDEYDTIEDIRRAKEAHDRVIVTYHGGKEMCQYPSPRLRKLCRAMARNGADVVLCQHSHCIGVYEKYENCHILYGQGNFHFVEYNSNPLWNTALSVEYDTVSHEMSFTPLRMGDVGIDVAKGNDGETIMSEFFERSKTLENGEWKKGWHDFCEMKKDGYIQAISRACLEGSTEKENGKFGHYLDCEAHTDVWRELFPTYNQTNEK